MLSFVSCGKQTANQQDEQKSNSTVEDFESGADSIDGKWQGEDNGDPYYLYIEDGKVLMDFFGDAYKGVVDEENKTITMDYTADGETKETVFDYDTIGEQLVLSVDPEKNPGRNADVYSYTKVEEDTE